MPPDSVFRTSTSTASGPARCRSRPGGAPACAIATRMLWTTSVSAPLLDETDPGTVTTAWAARPSGDVPPSFTEATPGTSRTACSTWLMAAASAAVSGPDAREATMVADCFGSTTWNGAASWLARTLGADEELNEPLLAWVTVVRPGSRRAPATTPTSHTATISHLNRMSNLAMAANMATPSGRRVE